MDLNQRKVFVGGLSWNTTTEKLEEYFSQYGPIANCQVITDRDTGRSRGFGFVSFRDLSTTDAVVNYRPHKLNGRTIDVKRRCADARPKVFVGTNVPRVFLGGLPPNITETELRLIFEEFGSVTDVVIVVKDDKRLTGIAFVSFEEQNDADVLIRRQFIRINGKQVEIKRARPRNSDNELLLRFSQTSVHGTSSIGLSGDPAQDLISLTRSHNDDDCSSDDGSVITVIKKF